MTVGDVLGGGQENDGSSVRELPNPRDSLASRRGVQLGHVPFPELAECGDVV
jgi:hypothetical protein